jgi:hypothetical protein
MAIGSLICGIVGMLCFGIILGPIAVVLGFMARNQIKMSGGTQSGDGMALAGIILGFVAVAVFFIFLALGFGNAFSELGMGG